LTVTVLTTGFWPSYKSFDLNLPAEMVSWIWSWYNNLEFSVQCWILNLKLWSIINTSSLSLSLSLSG
jgi:hypothetical protein